MFRLFDFFIGRSHLPEPLLLRDALYLLQGIPGKYVRFSSLDRSDPQNKLIFTDDSVSHLLHLCRFPVKSISFQKYTIPESTKTLIHRLSEVGYLYTRVQAFIDNCNARSGVGMIEQSLCHHLHAQLTEYYKIIAILESQSPPRGNMDTRESGQLEGEEEMVLTLRRLDVWINEWRLRMRMMSVCVEGAQGVYRITSKCLFAF